MKLMSMNFDDNEELSNINLNMTAQEATALTNILGKLNGHAHRKLSINSDMYDVLSSVFNMLDEEGVKDLHIDLPTINEG